MGLRDTLRNAVALTNRIVGGDAGLQTTVYIKRFSGMDAFGTKSYDDPEPVQVLEEWKQRQVRTVTGDLTVCRASLQFLVPMVIDENDLFVLTDGTESPILDMGGFVNPSTGQPFATEVFLG